MYQESATPDLSSFVDKPYYVAKQSVAGTELLNPGIAQLLVDQTTFSHFRDRLPVGISGGPHTQTTYEHVAPKERIVALENANALDAFGEFRATLAMRMLQGDEGSREHQARFDELTNRLRRLDPQVTTANIDALSDMVKGLEEISSEMEALRKRHEL